MVQLTPHFTLEECVYSDTAARLGIDNTPRPWQVSNLVSTCTRLGEPARALWGVPCHVNSGFRSVALNKVIPGSSHTSAHCFGLALDLRPIGIDPRQCFAALHAAHLGGQFDMLDQAILEYGSWIHLALGSNGQARGEFLVKLAGVDGYLRWPPAA